MSYKKPAGASEGGHLVQSFRSDEPPRLPEDVCDGIESRIGRKLTPGEHESIDMWIGFLRGDVMGARPGQQRTALSQFRAMARKCDRVGFRGLVQDLEAGHAGDLSLALYGAIRRRAEVVELAVAEKELLAQIASLSDDQLYRYVPAPKGGRPPDSGVRLFCSAIAETLNAPSKAALNDALGLLLPLAGHNLGKKAIERLTADL